jgi:ATP/maltotriose-dependent transcriptional regulator MalT
VGGARDRDRSRRRPGGAGGPRRLRPLLDGIHDPYLHAVSQLVLAWASPIAGDLEGARLEALEALDQLRNQDEPYWTAVALQTAGFMETEVGRYDDALGHMREARDLAERFDNAWLAAISRAHLGTLALARSRPEEARALLDEALDLSVATQTTHAVTLSLVGFARAAFMDGDAERAALLTGAAEGLRRRVGLRMWPSLRGAEAELGAQVREALGRERFEEVFAAGVRLNQREAVAAARDRRGQSAS